MNNEEVEYPQYRKYVGIDVWYKINSPASFTEIKQVGSQIVVHEIQAEQYPEKLRIQDMISCHEDRWEPVGPAEVESLLEKA